MAAANGGSSHGLHCSSPPARAVDQHPPRRRRWLVVAPRAALHARLARVLGPLVGGPVAGERRGRVRRRVAHPPRALLHCLQLVAPVPAPGVGTYRQQRRPAPASMPARPASRWVASPLTCRAGWPGVACAGATGRRCGEQLALCGAVLARRSPRCLVHTASPPHRLGPSPRAHNRSPVDLDRFSRAALGVDQTQGPTRPGGRTRPRAGPNATRQ